MRTRLRRARRVTEVGFGERNDLNGEDEEEITSLGVEFTKGRNMLKGEVEEVMQS